jgi:hypothetical protein
MNAQRAENLAVFADEGQRLYASALTTKKNAKLFS